MAKGSSNITIHLRARRIVFGTHMVISGISEALLESEETESAGHIPLQLPKGSRIRVAMEESASPFEDDEDVLNAHRDPAPLVFIPAPPVPRGLKRRVVDCDAGVEDFCGGWLRCGNSITPSPPNITIEGTLVQRIEPKLPYTNIRVRPAVTELFAAMDKWAAGLKLGSYVPSLDPQGKLRLRLQAQPADLMTEMTFAGESGTVEDLLRKHDVSPPCRLKGEIAVEDLWITRPPGQVRYGMTLRLVSLQLSPNGS